MSLSEIMGRIFGSGPRPGSGVIELARRLAMSVEALNAVRPTYRTFDIPKRDGRTRTICAPAPELRDVQRRILQRVLRRLRAHPAAHGFERDRSIVTNAECHAGQAVVARLDVRDFFPSTRARRIEDYFRKIGWDRESAALLTRLCAWKGALPQGAPTSPRLSNLVNYRLDARLSGLAKAAGAVYTRYADDITFSFAEEGAARGSKAGRNPKTGRALDAADMAGRSVGGVLHAAALILADEGYEVHTRRKMSVRRRHQRQVVTGLVVNERPRLPRQTRRRLRAIEHALAAGRPVNLTEAQLAGWRAFAGMVERDGMPDSQA